MMIAIGAMLLLHHLYSAVTPQARGGIRLAVLALAAMWSIDLLLCAAAYAFSAWYAGLIAARGIVMVLAAPMFAIAVQRN
ncbi:hypothetical protein AB0148_26935, partial [Klebsiella pneumoniae]